VIAAIISAYVFFLILYPRGTGWFTFVLALSLVAAVG
jgi:hypothetical protein